MVEDHLDAGDKRKEEPNKDVEKLRLLCELEACASLGEETLLGGPGFTNCCKVKVGSVQAEVWLLPASKAELAEQMGLTEHLQRMRNKSMEEVERHIDENADWLKTKRSCLRIVQDKDGTTDQDDFQGKPLFRMKGTYGGYLDREDWQPQENRVEGGN